MKKLFLIMFVLSLILGCSAKESGEDLSKAPAGTREAESLDTTSMDSASLYDTTIYKDTIM